MHRNIARIGKNHLYPATHQISHALRAPLVGNVLQLGPGHHLEQYRRKVRAAAFAGGGIAELLLLRPGQRNKFLQRGGRHAGIHGKQEARTGDGGDCVEVLEGVIGQMREQAGVGHMRGSHQQDGVTVGRGSDHCLAADDGIATAAVIHDHRLAPPVRQLLRRHACHGVSTAARRKRNDEAHRLHRIPLLRDSRQGQRQQWHCDQQTNKGTRNLQHCFPLTGLHGCSGSQYKGALTYNNAYNNAQHSHSNGGNTS